MNKEEKALALAGIRIDLSEFLKYVRIQEPGELALKYELWPHLLDFFERLDRYKLNVVDKSKQVGISWAIALRVLRRLMTVPGSNVLEISSGEKEAQKLLGKTRIIFNNLPEWIKNEPDYALEYDSTEQFGFKGMKSMVTALASTKKAGIGQTSDWAIHDEADFHDEFEVNLGHTLATVADSPFRELTIVSTVDKTKPDSYFKRLYKGAKESGWPEEGANNFRALFLPYNVRPNRDEAWYQQEERLHTDKPGEMEANYPRTVEESLSPQSATSCFDKDRLDNLWANVVEPEIRQDCIYILCPPRVGTQYVAGVDVGEGVGLDYSCLTIVGKEGLGSEVVATIYSNTIGTDAFAFEVDRLCREYFTPLLVVDNIGIGRAVIDKLEQLAYPRLYRPDPKKKVGWSLTRPNKRELLVKLVELINNESLITRWQPQVKELMEYQWINAYPEPTGKTHGDTVIPLELICAVWDKVGKVQEASMYVGGRKIW